MTLLNVIRIFVLSIFFNMILPSGDVYSDIALMYQTWTFRTAESYELVGCRACYDKNIEDLIPSKKDCTLCITKHYDFACGGLSPMRKLLEIDNAKKCENSKWGLSGYEDLESSKCKEHHNCCFETNDNFPSINYNFEDKTVSNYIDPRLLVVCSFVRDYLGPTENELLIKVCLLVGKTSIISCLTNEVFPNKEDIKYFLGENSEVFKMKNFTSQAYKIVVKNPSTSGSTRTSRLSTIVPVKSNNLSEDEIFECGILIKRKNTSIIGDYQGVDCGMDICKVHLDYLHKNGIAGIYDLKSWRSKSGYLVNDQEQSGATGIRVGGKNCHLLRVYAWSMFIPITINFLFSAMIFFRDVKSGVSRKYEIPVLFFLLYPQWRTFKILIRYLKHKKEEELTNQLDENDRDVSFIEPFCESAFQVSFLLSI